MTDIKYMNEYEARHGAPYWEDPAPNNEPLNYLLWALYEATALEFNHFEVPNLEEKQHGLMYTTYAYRDDYTDDYHGLQVYAEPDAPAITFYVDDVRVHIWRCNDIIDLANTILDYSWDDLYSECYEYGYQAFIKAGAGDNNQDGFDLTLNEHVKMGNFSEV